MITRIAIQNGNTVRIERGHKHVRIYKNVHVDRIYALHLAMSYAGNGFTHYHYSGGAEHQRIITS